MRLRAIDWAPGYFVSDDGRVFSEQTRGPRGRRVSDPRRERVPSRSKKYLHVTLHVDGRKITVDVHKLVAEAFIGPCPRGLEVRHKDGDQRNNGYRNLEYGTRSQNMHDKERHGTATIGERHPMVKLTEAKVREIRAADCSRRGTMAALARTYGVAPSTITIIRQRKKTWLKPTPKKEPAP